MEAMDEEPPKLRNSSKQTSCTCYVTTSQLVINVTILTDMFPIPW